MADAKDKACPFRVRTVYRDTVIRGRGPSTTQEFHPCLGEGCAAYYPGGCLLLMPPIMAYDPQQMRDVCLICKEFGTEACETCAGGTTLDDNTLIPMTDGEKHCLFCEDYDEFSQIVCYLPTGNGDCIPIPMNRCPVCGADMTGGGAK